MTPRIHLFIKEGRRVIWRGGGSRNAPVGKISRDKELQGALEKRSKKATVGGRSRVCHLQDSGTVHQERSGGAGDLAGGRRVAR